MQVTGSVVLPVLASARGDFDGPDAPVLDSFLDGLAVAYAFGPPYRGKLVSWRDLDRMGTSRRLLRREAAHNLDARSGAIQVHGQPPALMLAFDGIASSLLLVEQLWRDLSGVVPGELVVGVPARDVVIVTGTGSPPGLAKARRAVDRIFFAGDRHLLTPHLLVRRRGMWEIFAAGSGSAPVRHP